MHGNITLFWKKKHGHLLEQAVYKVNYGINKLMFVDAIIKGNKNEVL